MFLSLKSSDCLLIFSPGFFGSGTKFFFGLAKLNFTVFGLNVAGFGFGFKY